MNIFKIFTRGGRQDLVRDIIKEYATPETIAGYAADGVAKCLEAGAAKLSDERVNQISVGCEYGGRFCANLAKAVNPNGDGGTQVTEEEKAAINEDITVVVEKFVTPEFLNGVVETIISKVP